MRNILISLLVFAASTLYAQTTPYVYVNGEPVSMSGGGITQADLDAAIAGVESDLQDYANNLADLPDVYPSWPKSRVLYEEYNPGATFDKYYFSGVVTTDLVFAYGIISDGGTNARGRFFDIESKFNPVELSLHTDGLGWIAQDIFYEGNGYLYFVGNSGGGSYPFVVMDATDPENSIIYNIPGADASQMWDIQKATLQGTNMMYVSQVDGGKVDAWQMIDATNLVKRDTFSGGGFFTGLLKHPETNVLYAANYSQQRFYVFTLAGTNMTKVAEIATSFTMPNRMAWTNDHLYIVRYNEELLDIFDTTAPTNPTLVKSSFALEGNAPVYNSIQICGDFLFAGNSEVTNVGIYDIQSPEDIYLSAELCCDGTGGWTPTFIDDEVLAGVENVPGSADVRKWNLQDNPCGDLAKLKSDTIPAFRGLHVTEGISVGPHVDFDDSGPASYKEGRMTYDPVKGNHVLYNDRSNTALDVGYEGRVHAKNDTGVTIPPLRVVYVSGDDGSGNKTVELASSIEFDSSRVLGVTTESIDDGDIGEVTLWGDVNDEDTSGLALGAVWLNDNGLLTSTRPSGGHFSIIIGVVTVSDAERRGARSRTDSRSQGRLLARKRCWRGEWPWVALAES